MLLVGGMVIMQNILACQEWQWIILLSLISDHILFFDLYTLMTMLLATSVGVE
jgi:hypothetical protein